MANHQVHLAAATVQFVRRTIDFLKKTNKDQNDRIGKIYRFKTSLDHFVFEKPSKINGFGEIAFSSSILISESELFVEVASGRTLVAATRIIWKRKVLL